MRGIISLPFRFVRAGRFGLIAVGAGVTGLGLWLQLPQPPDDRSYAERLRRGEGGGEASGRAEDPGLGGL